MAKKNKVIKAMGDVGVDKIPETIPKPQGKDNHEQNTIDRAMTIIRKHKQAMENNTDNILMQRAEHEWLVASLERGVYYIVSLKPKVTDADEDTWECKTSNGICPAKQFYPGDCKHILAIKIAMENKVTIPSEADVMKEMFDNE